MTSSSAVPPEESRSGDLFGLIFSEESASPRDPLDELQRIDWAIRPATIPKELPSEVREEVEELKQLLNSLQQPIVTKSKLPVEGNSPAMPDSIAARAKGFIWRSRLQIILTAAAALAGIATVITLTAQPFSYFAWKQPSRDEPSDGGGNSKRPPISEADQARQLVQIEYSLANQTAEFLGERWLIASRRAELAAGTTAAARTDAVDRLDQEMEELQRRPELDAAAQLSLGQWRHKRGEWGLAAQAFRAALRQKQEATDAWVGLALTIGRRGDGSADVTSLRRILTLWMEQKDATAEQQKQLRDDLAKWVKANETVR